MPARAPAKATVKVESELSTRRLCWTDGGCSGEKVGEMRGAAGLALGSPAGFMSTGGCEVDDVYDRGCLESSGAIIDCRPRRLQV